MQRNYGMGTEGLDKVLIDTSVWIEFFRKREPYYRKVLKLIDNNQACCIGLILAELIQGAKSNKAIEIVKDFIHVFDFLKESVQMWEKSGELSYRVRKAGKKAGLSDCYIAIAAKINNAAILTMDSHFELIKEHINITLF